MPVSHDKDYYDILGVEKNANQQEIKEAYRKLAFQYHPDRNKDDPAASDKMKVLNEAYAILSDPNKRKEYDLLRERYGSLAYEQYRQTHSQEDIFSGTDIGQIFQEFARSYGFRNADEIFREFYGPGSRYNSSGLNFRSYTINPDQNNNNNAMPTIPFNQMGLGGRLIKFFLEKILGIKLPEKGKDINRILKVPFNIARLGGEVKYRYRTWGKAKDLIIKIPTGIQEGQKIRLREMGSPGKSGGPAGDIILTVKIKTSFLRRIKAILKI